MAFLNEFYDVQHTHSFDDTVDDLTQVCINNGGAGKINSLFKESELTKMSDIEFLKEANTQDVIKIIVDDKNIDIINAMIKFYDSEVFEKLENEETGLYRESPAYLYDLYQNELDNNGIVQEEI